MNPLKRAEIIRLYGEDLSMAAVADKAGVSPSTVHRVVRRAAVNRPRYGAQPPTPEQGAAVTEDCTTGGMTQAAAAAKYGISRAMVSRMMREHGGMVPPGVASVLAGISAGKLRILADAGEIRHAGREDDGRYLYYRADMIGLAAGRRMLEALRWAWEGVYSITDGPDGLEAARADCLGSVHAADPLELRDRLLADHARTPVLLR